ncbi:MAG: type II toxin-antitoxin system HicB family antitoxin [Thermoguttaceae bacterium]
MRLDIEIDREEDGRFIAEVPAIPGAMAYGQTREEALTRVQAMALRVLADRVEHGESIPAVIETFLTAP